jgi:flavin reductase (DIM6/NTAB) family NADH-FMN oxidoreductase RutF
MRISIPLAKAYHLMNHGACPLITTGDGVRRDVAPINWTMPILDDPFLVVTVVEEGIFTDELIKASGEFAVNVIGEALAPQVLGLGKTSGRDLDKFSAFGLETTSCEKIKPPRLAAAAAHLECRVKDRHPYPGVTLYVAEVLHAEVEESCWDGRHLRLEKIRTLHHVGGGLFAVTDRAVRFEPASPSKNPK